MSIIRWNGRLAAVLVALVSLSCLLSSCGGTSGPAATGERDLPAVDMWPAADSDELTATRDGCGILAGPATRGGNFVFTLTDSVLPDRAPIPHNVSERVVFAQLYETLVQVDCSGGTKPGLAESWTCTDDLIVWTFTLREGARFWDGSRVTATEVRQAWGKNISWPVEVLDEQRLSVRLTEPDERFPVLLADPSTSVAVRRPGWIWPVGSGPGRLRASDPAPLPDLTCRPNQNHPAGPVWKSLTFRISPGADPRDLVATDMDLALVRRRDVVEFFDDTPGFRSVPLPWNRLYLLVCPPEMNSPGAGRWPGAAAKLEAGRDVTAVSARAWSGIVFPAGGTDSCPRPDVPVPDVGSARLDWNLAEKNLNGDVIVYPDNDPGARDMAQRLGALAGRPARTAAVPADAVDFTLQWQMAGAFVLPVPQLHPTGCLQLAALLGKADWLMTAALGRLDQPAETLAAADQGAAVPLLTPTEALTSQGLVRPLGLSRSWLVVRGSLAGLDLAFDGTPMLSGLGAAPEGTPGEATP